MTSKEKIAFCISEDYNPGAAYVMAYLRSKGHDVRLFFDPRQFNRGYIRNGFLARVLDIRGWLIKEIKRFNPDKVCFSVNAASYQWGIDFARKVKGEVGCRIIFGGTMPTLVPEVVKKHQFIDEVVEGDGLKYFGGEFNPDILYPAREDFFGELPKEHQRTQLFMTRYGCPFSCLFCGNQQLREVGHHLKLERTVSGCIKELIYMKQAYGLKKVLFVDDIFTINKKWVLKFLEIYKEKITLPFDCFGHAQFLDEEIIKKLAAAGCKTIWMGIQTGFEPHRKMLNRNETNEQIIKVSKWIKENNIKLMVDHICGLPFESDLTHDVSYALYGEIGADVVNVYECLYFPKAGINKMAIECGYLKPEDIELINEGKHVVYQQGNGGPYYDKYAKSLVTLPLKGAAWEFLPLGLIKFFVNLRAGRGFIIRVILENEIFFTLNAILKKMGLKRHDKNYSRETSKAV